MNAVIKSTNGNDSVVEFTLSDGSKSTQTIAGVPVYDETETANFLKKYLEAYEQGLATEAAQVAQGLVGKTIDL